MGYSPSPERFLASATQTAMIAHTAAGVHRVLRAQAAVYTVQMQGTTSAQPNPATITTERLAVQ